MTIKNINPTTNEVFAELESSSEEQIKQMVKSAHNAQQNWQDMGIEGRVRVLRRLYEVFEAEKEYYLTTIHLVEIGTRSHIIFARSKPMEKRALLNFVLSNATLRNNKVLYTAKFPFSEMVKYGDRPTMLPD